MKANDLLPLVYQELRKIAASKMANEAADHTLNATALVHEAFLKLGVDRDFQSSADFFQAAAQAMRRILVDHARARNTSKRGGGNRVVLDFDPEASEVNEDLEALDEALTKLAQIHPKIAEMIELRRFAGLTLTQCAEILQVSPRTVDTWWAYGRAWLRIELSQ